jgi:hypothetical protein
VEEALARMWREITERPDGPLAFRFYLQPLVALAMAVRDGIRDAREGRSPYLWSLLTEPAHRRESLRSGSKSVGRTFLVAVVLDVLYQVFVLKGVRPVAGLLVAVVLALVPYALLRGPVNRVARALRRPGGARRPV